MDIIGFDDVADRRDNIRNGAAAITVIGPHKGPVISLLCGTASLIFPHQTMAADKKRTARFRVVPTGLGMIAQTAFQPSCSRDRALESP